MRDRLVQLSIVGVLAVGLAIVVARNADSWADWVVLGVIVLTTFGFAIAIAPNLYARRKRVISRSSSSDADRGPGRD